MTTKNPLKISKHDHVALKKFAFMMAWAFPLFIGVIAPLLLGKTLQWWTLIVSIVFVLFAFIAPTLIYYPYRIWMFIGGIIGFINTRLILGFTFFLLIFPIGLVLRALNKLQYKSRGNASNNSNYVLRKDKIEKKQLEHPF
ncbi:MAG: SxtJ family membrane protein [Colwellia sp.]